MFNKISYYFSEFRLAFLITTLLLITPQAEFWGLYSESILRYIFAIDLMQ